MSDKVMEYFTQVFGKVSLIDEALAKIKGRGYAHYYNDVYSNKEVIDRLKKGLPVNCTDGCQMVWHLAKALGYDVKCIHVKCKSGDGHVRLQLKHSKNTNDKWIDRDPACVISNNGKPINAIWCANGKLIDVNPAWFMEGLNR